VSATPASRCNPLPVATPVPPIERSPGGRGLPGGDGGGEALGEPVGQAGELDGRVAGDVAAVEHGQGEHLGSDELAAGRWAGSVGGPTGVSTSTPGAAIRRWRCRSSHPQTGGARDLAGRCHHAVGHDHAPTPSSASPVTEATSRSACCRGDRGCLLRLHQHWAAAHMQRPVRLVAARQLAPAAPRPGRATPEVSELAHHRGDGGQPRRAFRGPVRNWLAGGQQPGLAGPARHVGAVPQQSRVAASGVLGLGCS
jgi:hypothetical protein